jgi:hypothetical protein
VAVRKTRDISLQIHPQRNEDANTAVWASGQDVSGNAQCIKQMLKVLQHLEAQPAFNRIVKIYGFVNHRETQDYDTYLSYKIFQAYFVFVNCHAVHEAWEKSHIRHCTP